MKNYIIVNKCILKIDMLFIHLFTHYMYICKYIYIYFNILNSNILLYIMIPVGTASLKIDTAKDLLHTSDTIDTTFSRCPCSHAKWERWCGCGRRGESRGGEERRGEERRGEERRGEERRGEERRGEEILTCRCISSSISEYASF